MKIRNGFVSNSSSSSFVIAYKGTKAELKKKIDEAFKLVPPKSYPIRSSGIKNFGDTIVGKLREKGWNLKNLKKFEESFGEESDGWMDPKLFAKLRKRIESGDTVQLGEFCDDCDDMTEWFLCNSEIRFESDDFFLESDEGY